MADCARAGGGKPSRHERNPPRYVHTWLEITRTLVDFIEASEQLGSKIQLQFNTRLIDVDLRHHQLRTLQDDQVKTINYDVLVGADGAHSAVSSSQRGMVTADECSTVLSSGGVGLHFLLQYEWLSLIYGVTGITSPVKTSNTVSMTCLDSGS